MDFDKRRKCLFLIDSALFSFTYFLAYFLRFQGFPSLKGIFSFFLIYGVIIFVFWITDFYSPFFILDKTKFVQHTLKDFTYILLLAGFVIFFIHTETIEKSRMVILGTLFTYFFVFLAGRFYIYEAVLGKKKLHVYVYKDSNASTLTKEMWVKMHCVPTCQEEHRTVFLFTETKSFGKLLSLIESFKGKKLIVFSPLAKKAGLFSPWYDTTIKGVFEFNFKSPGFLYRFTKRTIDFMLSLLGLGVLAPFLTGIGVIIKLTSKGSIIYRQERLKKDKEKFILYKFRTMYQTTSAFLHEKFVRSLITNGGNSRKRVYKLKNDKRVTPFGRFLRKTSFDEFPQLFNVLRGDLSLIGPRPPLEYEVKYYKPWHNKRLSVKQGLSGPWQVFGRSALCFDGAVFLDIYYVYNRSLLLDLKLILYTLPVMLFGKGGY